MTNGIVVREVNIQDLRNIAEVHMQAFPESALTRLGREPVRRYYEWQLTGPHDVAALVALSGDKVAGFVFGGTFRGALGGFLHKNRGFLVVYVLTHPWLIANPLFRERLFAGIGALRRKVGRSAAKPATDAKPAASAAPDAPAARPRFGILSIAVSPTQQGKGVGRVLMDASGEIARERGFEEMSLTVHPSNVGGVLFYERLGWDRITTDQPWSGAMRKGLNQ